ncbi:hypothetical protein JTB14_032588 [Gonioctena quinquepunctata]|nr:hypothetical protein JTB14_032588 [Gonioctena quinquepunctata]
MIHEGQSLKYITSRPSDIAEIHFEVAFGRIISNYSWGIFYWTFHDLEMLVRRERKEREKKKKAYSNNEETLYHKSWVDNTSSAETSQQFTRKVRLNSLGTPAPLTKVSVRYTEFDTAASIFTREGRRVLDDTLQEQESFNERTLRVSYGVECGSKIGSVEIYMEIQLSFTNFFKKQSLPSYLKHYVQPYELTEPDPYQCAISRKAATL